MIKKGPLQPDLGSNLLDLLGVLVREKNTFLEFSALPAEGCVIEEHACDHGSGGLSGADLARCQTTPGAYITPGHSNSKCTCQGSLSGEGSLPLESPQFGPSDCHKSQGMTNKVELSHLKDGAGIAPVPAESARSQSASRHARVGSLSEEVEMPSETSPPEPPASTCGLSATFTLDAKLLSTRDTRKHFQHEFFGPEGSIDMLVVRVVPKPASKRRGGACFRASKGWCSIEVKINSDVAIPDTDMSLSVSVGGGVAQSRRVEHNFGREPVCKIPGEWNLSAAVDPSTQTAAIEVSVRSTQ